MKTPEVMNGLRAAPLGMSSPPAIYKDLVITGSRVQEMPVKGAAGDVRAWDARTGKLVWTRSEAHTSELQSLMRISYAVFCLKKKQYNNTTKDLPSVILL